MSITTHLYRHDDIVIFRPYACDVDHNDWLWQGTSRNRLLGHNLRTAELRVIDIPEMEGDIVFEVFAWQEKLLLIFSKSGFYLVHDPDTGQTQRYELPPVPGKKTITWYGCRMPDGRLIVFDRGAGRLFIFDAPDAAPRVVTCPYEGDIWYGTLHSDGLIYIFLGDPARVIRFDPSREEFVDEQAMPWPEVGPSGRFEHNGTIYVADSAGGRMLPLDIKTQQWGEPICHPDFEKVFGFIGLAFTFKGKGYFNLSNYASRSMIDTKTGQIRSASGKIILPGDPLPTVDNEEERFLERFLIFDPETQSFEYLTAPDQPDGKPLLCYYWADEERFLITGFVLPWGKPGKPQTFARGPWLILQSEPATEEPGYQYYDFSWDRDAHIRSYRRSYRSSSSVYLPQAEHSPPIVNMEGSPAYYPDGKMQGALRRAARTDRKAYWQGVCTRILAGETDTAAQFKLILEHVQQSIYYNPIQTLDTEDTIAVHQMHDGRCGQGAAMVMSLCEAAGIPARLVPLQNHVVTEALCDGSWHYGDPLFFGAKQPERDGRILSADELKADPYYADKYPQSCFAYDPELLLSEDGFQVQGYVFGPWGSEPYYSFYLGAGKVHPPSLPTLRPVQRAGEGRVKINWSPAFKMGGGNVEYELRIFEDRKCTQELLRHTTAETSFPWDVPEQNRMYFLEVRAMDDHRQLQPDTWYPAARSNFVLVPEDQYGWYGVF